MSTVGSTEQEEWRLLYWGKGCSGVRCGGRGGKWWDVEGGGGK